MEPTRASDIAMPEELVELDHLKTREGAPVRVLCFGLDELTMVRLVQSWPGEAPPVVEAEKSQEQNLREMEQVMQRAGPLIEAGTALVDADGTEVRPAFYFGAAAPCPESKPGRSLRMPDRIKLASAILRLSGREVGPTASHGFHGGERAGDDAGVAAGAGGADVQPDPVGDGH